MKASLTLGYIQYDIKWEDKDANFAFLDNLINESYRDESIIILPEMFATGFSMDTENIAESMDGQTLVWMWSVAKKHNCIVAGSLPIIDSGKTYNRFVWVNSTGVIDYYDKQHLFTPAGEHEVYTAGTSHKIFEIEGWKIKPLICYDLRFPSIARNKPEGYDLLIYVASWPKKRTGHWDKLLAARAIENQCYCLGVNRIGVDGNDLEYIGSSALYNHNGMPLSRAKSSSGYSSVTLDQSHLTFRKKFNFLGDQRI